eukprot:scaffold12848_cov140-Isochrysis_galbana.AAC.4
MPGGSIPGTLGCGAAGGSIPGNQPCARPIPVRATRARLHARPAPRRLWGAWTCRSATGLCRLRRRGLRQAPGPSPNLGVREAPRDRAAGLRRSCTSPGACGLRRPDPMPQPAPCRTHPRPGRAGRRLWLWSSGQTTRPGGRRRSGSTGPHRGRSAPRRPCIGRAARHRRHARPWRAPLSARASTPES